MPIGMPGCPLLAASTASIARARMALASRRWVGMRSPMGRPRVEDSAGRWFGAYCRGAAWRQPYARFTTACGQLSICYAFATMSTRPLEEAVERAERALLRIERAVERGTMHQ